MILLSFVSSLPMYAHAIDTSTCQGMTMSCEIPQRSPVLQNYFGDGAIGLDLRYVDDKPEQQVPGLLSPATVACVCKLVDIDLSVSSCISECSEGETDDNQNVTWSKYLEKINDARRLIVSRAKQAKKSLS
eukprot:NODE_153_length_16933_cov_0.442141.p11 type:complete len:131 gc:universal NODE_153_length_16933_cov_0.442141:1066-674(-)